MTIRSAAGISGSGRAGLAGALRVALALGMLLLPLARPAAEGGRVRFVNVGLRDGLANASVSSFVQDAAGFIWVGTQGGLHRWDGTSFRLYENEPFDRSSLPHNLIQTMFMDPDGTTIWLGTYGGLVRFDTRTETFRSWKHDPSDPSSLVNDVVVAIARDADGRIWAGTLDGLDRLDEAGGTFVHYRPDGQKPGALGSGVIRALYLDSRGLFWVGTSGGGLHRYRAESDDFERLVKDPGGKGLPSDYVFGISEDSSGALWLGLWYWGLSRFDPVAGTFENRRLDDDRVYFVNASEDGAVRAGTWGGGLFELDTASGNVSRYRSDDARQWALPHDTIYSMLVDRAGEVWVGTNGGGFSHMMREPDGFMIYEHAAADPGSRSSGKTISVLEDSRGRLWVGCYNNGLDRLDPGAGGFRHYRHDKADTHSLPDDIVNRVYEDSSGTVWVATNHGVARYDEDSDRFLGFHDPSPAGRLLDDVIYDIVEDPASGGLWFATYTAGLVYWDRAADLFFHHPAKPGEPGGLADNLVYGLCFDARSRLWAATNAGLSRYEGAGVFRTYVNDPDDMGSLPSRIARNVMADSLGRVWVACNGGGVARYDEASDSFEHWTKRDGLPSNVVLGLQEGRAGQIWASTAMGLAVLDEAAGRFRPLSAQSDLRVGEFTVGMARSPSGRLYFGALNALYAIDPDVLAYDRKPPVVRLTSIKLPGDLDYSPEAPWFVDRVQLPWNRASLSFSFAALDYSDASRNQYAYMLEGFDADWVYSGSRAYASYTSLPPGRTYAFKVRAANGDGVWSADTLTVRLAVTDNPWTSWWAFMLYAAALAGLAWSVIQARGRRMLSERVDDLSRLKGELEAANVRLEELASHDGLTGLMNRRSLALELERRFSAAQSLREPIAGLMVDIDCFKPYNDHYGHQEGDEALMQVAQVISRSLERPQDAAARYGGEEFFVLLPGADLLGAMTVAERIRAGVQAKAVVHGHSTAAAVLTVSVGAASFVPDPADSASRLFLDSDAALYRAKEDGRNRVKS